MICQIPSPLSSEEKDKSTSTDSSANLTLTWVMSKLEVFCFFFLLKPVNFVHASECTIAQPGLTVLQEIRLVGYTL